jgi:uncharacterized protein YajQ (UPF0234 family)
MAQDHSFDIVSKIDFQEVSNAVQTALKEILNRFDFKNSKVQILQDKDKLTITAEDTYKLKGVKEVLEQKMVKRHIPLRAVQYQKIEPAQGGMVRQEVHFQVGIPSEKAREIVKLIKQDKFKAQAAIQGDQVRVSSQKIDVLQEIIARLRHENLGIHMEFVNYR